MSKQLDDIGQWVADNIFGETLRQIFEDRFQLIGLGTILSILVSALIVVICMKILWEFATFFVASIISEVNPPAPDWENLDPDDETLVEEAFNNLHVVASLAHRLDEDTAENLDEFRDQLNRLNLFGKDLWDRLDPMNEKLMHEALKCKKTLERIARELEAEPAETLEEVKDQVRRVRWRRKGRFQH